MFIFTSVLWSSGIISQMTSYFPIPDRHDLIQSNTIISAISISLIQVLSNVPFAVIYNNVLINNGFSVSDGSSNSSSEIGGYSNQWIMLAAGSTVSGNPKILAAADYIIIIEAAESKDLKTFYFLEFSKIGAIITIITITIYYKFIVMIIR